MSLLEDIFLQDEADEAQELERVLEGDEYDERQPISEAEEDDDVRGDDEAEEDKRRVDPTSDKPKRVIKNPRFILNPARLTGPRGIQVLPEHFKDFKFKGKGHEKEDLDLVLKKLEHWAYRLYPKFQFEDCLKKIETLGKKRPVMVHLTKIRTDQFLSDGVVTQKDSDDEEIPAPVEEDEFDKLLQQQIDLARATPAPGSVRKVVETPKAEWNRSPFTMPKATSSPSISDEQKDRMIRNRKLAEERRLAKLKQNNTETINLDSPREATIPEIIELDEPVTRKHNRSNVIDSSDDECEVTTVNTSINVDVHTNYDSEAKTNEDVAIENGNSDDDNNTNNVNDEINIIKDVSETNNEEMEITEQDNTEKVNSNVDNESDKDTIGINGDENNEKDQNHTKDDNLSEEIVITDKENSNVNTDSNKNDQIGEPNEIDKQNTNKSITTSIELCIGKDNLDPSTVDSENSKLEDVMDVDFDEDF